MTSTAGELQPVVLIVGDEARVGLFPVDVFAEAGMRVVQAATATAALEILENRSDVLVLVTDLTSPEEADGLELAGIVQGRWPGVATVITSGPLDGSESEVSSALMRLLRVLLRQARAQ
jgi:DNA-binding NtrC family response regulator